jgi:hypothetical protein
VALGPSAAAAPPRNAFTGSFDIVDQGTAAVVGHVTATFNEAVEQQLAWISARMSAEVATLLPPSP